MPDTMTLLSLRLNNILENTVRTTTKQQQSNGFQHRMLCMLLMMRVSIFLHCTRCTWQVTTHRKYSSMFPHHTECMTLMPMPWPRTFPPHTSNRWLTHYRKSKIPQRTASTVRILLRVCSNRECIADTPRRWAW